MIGPRYLSMKLPWLWQEAKDDEHIQRIAVYREGNRVCIYLKLSERGVPEGIDELIQYLSPQEGMRMSQALEAAAIDALKNEGE